MLSVASLKSLALVHSGYVHVTVHEPQLDSPQLSLVPVRPKSLRKYSKSVWDWDGFCNAIRFPKKIKTIHFNNELSQQLQS